MRYHKIDGIRGILLISMILYHTCWDLVFLVGINIPGYTEIPGFLWQQSICWGFILLSGFCACLSRNNKRRGLIVFTCGLLVSGITVLVVPKQQVVFGVLTFLGSAMLLTDYLRSFFEKIPPLLGVSLFGLLFYVCYPINRGYLQWGRTQMELPAYLYRGKLMTYFGFMEPGFFSTDYYPLFPWFFLYLLGFECAIIIQDHLVMSIFEKSLCKPIEWMGRHALPIYLIHQPLIFILISGK